MFFGEEMLINGIIQDYREIFNEHERAAKQGNASAMNSLGLLHYYGLGVAKDNIKAHLYFSISAHHGYNDALINIGVVSNVMTKKQIEKAEHLKQEWILAFSEQLNTNEQNSDLGMTAKKYCIATT